MSQPRTSNKKSQPTVQNSEQCTSPGVPPINSLPDDVLTIVFQEVYRFWPCVAGLARCGLRSPERLMTLSHVCARWRRLVINSRTLWTHIVLVIGCPNWQGTLGLAEVYAVRADNLPLHFWLHIDEFDPECDQISARVEKLFGLVAARVKHLEASAYTIRSAVDPSHNFRSRTLSALLEGCTPGVLTTITLKNCDRDCFISSSEAARSDTDWQLSTPHEHLESLWESITVLQIDGLRPYWTSKAYHNLVELHIQATLGRPIDLPEPHLVEILKSSPGLRAIHLSIRLVDASPPGAPVTPVALESLEVLTIISFEYERVMRWFAPGPAFLKLCVNNLLPMGDFTVNEKIIELLKRSKKAGLKIIQSDVSSNEIAKVLYRVPGLRILDLPAGVVQHRRGVAIPVYHLSKVTTQQSNLPVYYTCLSAL